MSVLREIVVGIIGLTRERGHRSETPGGVTESQRRGKYAFILLFGNVSPNHFVSSMFYRQKSSL